MRHLLFIITVAVILVTTNQQSFAQQGFGTNQPNRSAAVDIVSTKRGLLIPRIALTSTTVAAPVSTPAQSLLVYNTATAGDVTPGFYFWETNKWVRFVSSDSEKTEVVTAGNNMVVNPTTVGNTTTFEVGLDLSGATAGQVLVTREITGASGEYEAVWVDAASLIAELDGTNGVTRVGNDFKLGGELTDNATVITTDGDDHTLAIAGLDDLSAGYTGQSVMVLEADGVLRRVSNTALVEHAIANGVGKTLTGSGITVTATGEATLTTSVAGSVLADVTLGIEDGAITTEKIDDGAVTTDKISAAGTANQVLTTTGTDPDNLTVSWVNQSSLVSADNGLTKDADNNIQLGGRLIRATGIETGVAENGDPAAGNTLAITGLAAGDATSRIIVQQSDGILRNVARSLSLPTATADYTVATQTGYDASAQEIHINAEPAAGDLRITLPGASPANRGQVVNIKKTSNEEDHYVEIEAASQQIEGAAFIYGALPHQGWVIKSDGTAWKVVGRN